MFSSSGDFDKGWFFCYKIILYIYAVLEAILVISNIARLSHLGSGFYVWFVYILEPLVLLIFVVCEILAMKNRDFQKAKIALYGFMGYIAVYIILFIIVLISNIDSQYKSELLIQMIVSLVVFFVFIVYGAVQVYKALGGAVPAATTNVYQAYHNA